MKFNLTEIKSACKENNIDPSPILASLKKARETAEKRPFWKCFLDVFHKFYKEVTKQVFIYLPRDWKVMEQLYDVLKKTCEERGTAWNEKMCCLGFEKYLQKAWQKDQWLRNNFTLPNILTQFNAIVNGQGTTKTVNADYKSKLLAGTKTS